MVCQDLGYSPKDCTTYNCSRGCEKGHLQFDRKQLEHMKDRGGPLLCKGCAEKDRTREASILARLRMPGSWKCTCKRISRGRRAYAALNENIGHRPDGKNKCPLSPVAFGAVRWDGKNNGVTTADLQFLVDRGSQW